MSNNWSAPIPNVIAEEKIMNYLERNSNRVYVAWYSFCLATGMIPNRALNLQVKDVKGKTKFTIEHYSKRLPSYTTVLDPITIGLIDEACEGKQPTDYVFAHAGNIGGVSSPPDPRQFLTVLKNAAAEFGLQSISTTSLKKTHILHIYRVYGINQAAILSGRDTKDETYKYLGIDTFSTNKEAEDCPEKKVLQETASVRIQDITTRLQELGQVCEDSSTPNYFFKDFAYHLNMFEKILRMYKEF